MSELPTDEMWSRYFEVTADRPPHPIYDLIDSELPPSGDAIDLGCGAGRGTLRLLSRGLRVTATDVSEEAIEILRARAPAGAALTLVRAPFQELALARYDVAVACYSLFFLSQLEFEAFWKRLVASIRPGGLFAGQFLGVNDDWRARGYAVVDSAGAERLMEPFDVLHFEQDEQDGETALGERKHWHVFHVVGRKR